MPARFAANLIACAIGLCVFALAIIAGRTIREREFTARWMRLLLAVTSAGLFLFIFHYGNRQLGGFDHSLLIDVGWRLANGQHPYTDFICTLPVGFFLGVKWAFLLLGPSWNAQLYLAGIFCAGTFLWIYALGYQLLKDRRAAYIVALAVECSSMVLISYWWYNAIASVAACLFLLSCANYFRRPQKWTAQLSYAGAFVLLAMMKPNVAIPLMVGAIVLMLSFGPEKFRLFALTVISSIAFVVLLAINHISVPQLMESYSAAAAGRGRIGLLAFRDIPPMELLISLLFLIALLLPMVSWTKQFLTALRVRDFERAACLAVVLLGPVVGVIAMGTNMEFKFVDMGLFLCFGAMVVFSDADKRPSRLRAMYLPILCALAAFTIYLGSARVRVAAIGPFFEWTATDHRTDTSFFQDFEGSPLFGAVMRDMQGATAKARGSVFFGPRMEFGYAAFRLPSPRHLPIWWHPGTSFALRDQESILKVWRGSAFETLIFFKNDFTYYPSEFLALLEEGYTRDDQSYETLTVFHSKPRS